MPKLKNQHFVPQFYLRLFSNPDKRSIGVFNIARQKLIPIASIADQASRPWFYGKDLTVERGLQNIETAIAPVLQRLAAGGHVPERRGDHHFALSIFVMLQRERTAAADQEMRYVTDQMGKAYLRHQTDDPEILKHLDQMTLSLDGQLQDGMNQAMSFGPMLWDMKLVVLENQSTLPFITSDAPVAVHNQWFEPVTITSALGYANAGLQVILPLGPWRALLIYDETTYSIGDKASHRLVLRNPEHVRSINDLQWENAEENLYVTRGLTDAQLKEGMASWADRRRQRKVEVDDTISWPTEEGRHHLITQNRLAPLTRLRLPQTRLLRAPPRITTPLQGLPLRNPEWARFVESVGSEHMNQQITGEEFMRILSDVPLPGAKKRPGPIPLRQGPRF
jgi:hypothetical protein